MIDPDGSIRGIYDKVHLVPFGEYLPFQRLLERLGLRQLTKQVGGFLSGDRRRAMDVPGAPKMLPLICYEAIFPGAAVPAGERPGWLVNVTNDGWFGISTGPYQHFQQARVLAIAEGLPLVRAANTGISAVVDPVGRIVASLPLGAEGVLDAGLPRAIAPTPYVRFGDTALIHISGGKLDTGDAAANARCRLNNFQPGLLRGVRYGTQIIQQRYLDPVSRRLYLIFDHRKVIGNLWLILCTTPFNGALQGKIALQ